MKDFPEEMMTTLISSFSVTVLSAIVTVIAEKDPDTWKLKTKMELIAVVSSVSI